MNSDMPAGLQKLIDAGTLTREQADAVQEALGHNAPVDSVAPNSPSSMFPSRRAFISEALTYVGFVFVIAAAALLTSQAWAGLGRWGQSGLLAAGAAVLFGAAFWMRMVRKDDSGRRLSSTLFVGSAALFAGTTGLILNEIWVPKNPSYLDAGSPLWQEPARWVNPAIVIGVALAALVVAVIGYLLSGSALGQLAMAAPSAVMAIGIGQLITALGTNLDDVTSQPRVGFAILFGGGLLWIALEHYGYLHEKVVGQALGIGALFIGLQGVGVDLKVWAGSSVLIVLGLGLLVFYLQGHAWPYLAGGIIGMFAGGVRLLVEYVHGTGGALASLGLGILLVFAGVRLVNDRREPMMLVQAESGEDEDLSMPNVVKEIKKDAEKYNNIEPY